MTDKKVLCDRAHAHAARFNATAPCGLSWDEVVQKVGTLHLPAFLAEKNKEKAAKEAAGKPYVEESRRKRRMLELYCGRAGLSAAFYLRGWDVKFLDNDRKEVQPTLNVLSKSGIGPKLREEDYIELVSQVRF